jgi:hypothetical protein
MRLLLMLSVGVLFMGSCKKDDAKTCIARSANGTAMYEVVGADVCDDQIDKANGEYCDCTEE